MKKAFSVLGAFCLGAFITIGVMACADDYSDGKTPTENEFGGAGGSLGSDSSTDGELEATVVEIKRTYDGSSYFDYEFIYDENSRIVQVKYEDYYEDDGPHKYNDSFDVTYNNNVVNISADGNITIKFSKDIESYPVGVINDYIINVVHSMGDL